MKKLITGILAILMCATSFVACNLGGGASDASSSDSSSSSSSSSVGGGNSSSVVEENALELARDFILGQYIDKNVETRQDYEVMGSYYSFVAQETFTVTWSVNVTEGVTIKAGTEGNWLVDVNEELSEDLPYVLTGTITDSKGDTATVTFNRVVTAAGEQIPVAITDKPVEGVAYKYHIYQSTLGKDLYFNGDTAYKTYYFGTTEVVAEAVDMYVEYIANSDNFYVYFMNNGTKTYVGAKLSADGGHDNIAAATTPVSEFHWDANAEGTGKGTIITHLDVSKSGSAADFYMGNYSNHDSVSVSTVDKIGGAGNNVGHLVVMTNRGDLTDEYKVGQIKDALSVQLDHTVDKTVVLPTTDSRYPAATIVWSSTADGVAIDNDQMTLTIPGTAATATLTATINLGSASATKDFTLNLGPKTYEADKNDPADIVTSAFGLAAGETLPGGNYTLTGEITKVNQEWNTTHSNITVTIKVEGKSIEVYRLKSGAADASTLKVGDVITVTGPIKNYNGTVEFDQGCVLDAVTASTTTEQSVQLSFKDVANRTSCTTEQQVWAQNGLTLTNNKASSSSNVNEKYSNPVRCYKGSEVIINFGNISATKIVFDCPVYDDNNYAENLANSLIAAGYTATVDGTLVTVEFAEPVTSITFTCSVAQCRIYTLTAYYKA